MDFGEGGYGHSVGSQLSRNRPLQAHAESIRPQPHPPFKKVLQSGSKPNIHVSYLVGPTPAHARRRRLPRVIKLAAVALLLLLVLLLMGT